MLCMFRSLLRAVSPGLGRSSISSTSVLIGFNSHTMASHLDNAGGNDKQRIKLVFGAFIQTSITTQDSIGIGDVISQGIDKSKCISKSYSRPEDLSKLLE